MIRYPIEEVTMKHKLYIAERPMNTTELMELISQGEGNNRR